MTDDQGSRKGMQKLTEYVRCRTGGNGLWIADPFRVTASKEIEKDAPVSVHLGERQRRRARRTKGG